MTSVAVENAGSGRSHNRRPSWPSQSTTMSALCFRCEAIHAGPLGYIAQRGAQTPYAVEDVAVTVYCANTLVRVGSYRSLGAAANHFARESHVDEIASTIGLDPFELRMRNLSDARYRSVLEAVASRFGAGVAFADFVCTRLSSGAAAKDLDVAIEESFRRRTAQLDNRRYSGK